MDGGCRRKIATCRAADEAMEVWAIKAPASRVADSVTRDSGYVRVTMEGCDWTNPSPKPNRPRSA